MYKRQTTIINKSGLHARPATNFVMEAKKYHSEIKITNLKTRKSENAKSLLKLLTLSLTMGTKVIVEADGGDEKAAVDHLVAMIDSGAGEEA